jgi:hypothetical protein
MEDRTNALPPLFVARMCTLLGGEADGFLAAYSQPELRGLHRMRAKLGKPQAVTAMAHKLARLV